MPVDLTRFDFNVLRFLNSPDVELMTLSEVGQYMLLLCKAWLNGDEASLPDDARYLQRICRGRAPTELVMSKWVAVATPKGCMLRNEVLYQEWLKAKQRSERHEESARSRWQGEPNVLRSESERNAIALQESMHRNAQGTPPIQSNPIQSKPPQITEETGVVSELLPGDLDAERLASLGAIAEGTPGYYRPGLYSRKPKEAFKYITAAWQKVRGAAAVCRYPNKYPELWEQLCEAHGGDLLVPAFELWAQDIGSRMNTQFPLPEFLRDAEKYMAKVIPLNAVRPEITPEQIEASTKAAASRFAKEAAVLEERKREDDKSREEFQAGIGDMLGEAK